MSGETILLDPTKAYQEVLGVGAALTEAACYMFNQLLPQVREQLFHELYHPSEMSFGICRTCIGSSDYSTVAYSYAVLLAGGQEVIFIDRYTISVIEKCEG
jgi:glucosylceramidase